jgi:hypothetical protein
MVDKDVAIQIAVHTPKVQAPAPAVPGAAEQALPGYPSGMTLTIQVCCRLTYAIATVAAFNNSA